MGTKRWNLANRKKPAGSLGRTGAFIAAREDLAACSVAVPVEMDKKRAIDAAVGLAGPGIRSLEVWWDGDEKGMEIVLVSEKGDMAAYRKAFANMYPNAAFSEMGSTTPRWFKAGNPCQIFDVGTRHGHYATVFDMARAHQLITQVASTVQLARRAWIQFVFMDHEFTPALHSHVVRLDRRAKEIRQGRHLTTFEGMRGVKPHDHPELGYDFINNYPVLQKHATIKAQQPQVMMSARGLVEGDVDKIGLDFDGIEALPVEDVRSAHEHLTKYVYKYTDFWSEKKPKRTEVRIRGHRNRAARLDMFPGRYLPDPDKILKRARSRYFDKRFLTGYREREPLPFLILNRSEIPLLVHLPDPATTPNTETTRGVTPPSRPSSKTGSCLGFLRSGGDGATGGSRELPGLGKMVRSRDAGAAVISPGDMPTHVYIVGASGSGKTSLIRLVAKNTEVWNQDGISPNAFICVDPKGDDSHKFVRQCDPRRVKSGMVHLLDPQETRFSINPLELPPHAAREREDVVSRYVGYFMSTVKEWYQQSESYVRMERIFRALLFYVYMRRDAPTFLDIHDIVLRLQDRGAEAMPQIVQTFGAPSPEMRQALTSIATLKGDAFVPLLNRIEQFATDPVLRRMFSVRRGTVDFGRIIEPGHQTIVRISPLNMPHHVQPLAMQAFILKLWFAIQERASRIPDEKERTPVVLAIDEFQIVKDLQVLQLMLEQARSLGLGLVLSHQTTDQISDRQLGLISGNSGTQLVGRVNGRDASRMAQIWDPQIQGRLTQQLASQEYFHWTMREKAPPGQEQPTPIQFRLRRPPELLLSDRDYDTFVGEQLAKYGCGTAGAGAIAEDGRARSRWLENISVELPTRMQWGVICMLHRHPMRQFELADGLGVQNRDDLVPVLRGMEESGLVARTDERRTAAYELTERCRKTYLEFDYSMIGTARDIPEIAGRAVEGYIGKGLFVAMASQRIRKGEDRTDLVAYDYEKDVAISVEIESASEVRSHPEHVKHNMKKWAALGFGACHVWSGSQDVRRIRDALGEGEKRGVSVIII